MGFTADTMYDFVNGYNEMTPGAYTDFDCIDQEKFDLFCRACYKLDPTKEQLRDMSCDGLKITRFIQKAFPMITHVIYCTSWDLIEGRSPEIIKKQIHSEIDHRANAALAKINSQWSRNVKKLASLKI